MFPMARFKHSVPPVLAHEKESPRGSRLQNITNLQRGALIAITPVVLALKSANLQGATAHHTAPTWIEENPVSPRVSMTMLGRVAPYEAIPTGSKCPGDVTSS